jgi:hypothetical protein
VSLAVKVLAIGGALLAGIMVLALGSNLGHSATEAIKSVSTTPTVSPHYVRAVISAKGLNETIYFKIVSTDTQKQAFVDGFTGAASQSTTVTAQVYDIPSLPANATYVCQVSNLRSDSSLQSIQVYGVAGDNLSRDIAQGGCDGANTR